MPAAAPAQKLQGKKRKRSAVDRLVIACYNSPMNNNTLADQLCTAALMFSLTTLDRRLLAAFDEDDQATIADCHDLFNALVSDVLNYIPAAAA